MNHSSVTGVRSATMTWKSGTIRYCRRLIATIPLVESIQNQLDTGLWQPAQQDRNKHHIEKLSKRFKVSPELFF
ncbi:MAG: hypothetical protein LAN18_13495 [Acidobacteriia bacterium]|nr:hypothetical protein [Terriglobia bacterium]